MFINKALEGSVDKVALSSFPFEEGMKTSMEQ